MIDKIYIAGKITGIEYYLFNFDNSERLLKFIYPEAIIINPAREGFEGEYYDILTKCLKKLETCNKIFLQYNYYQSKGANIEYTAARYDKKEVIFEELFFKEYEKIIKPDFKKYLTLELFEKSKGELTWN